MDITETLHGATVRHGPQSNRIYVMRLDTAAGDTLIEELDLLARQKGYTKIFAKIPADQWPRFKEHGYLQEAQIPLFYNGIVDCFFIAKFFSDKRQDDAPDEDLAKLLLDGDTATLAGDETMRVPSSPDQEISECSPAEAWQMSEVYRRVFASYPFPIRDPAYIKRTMAENIRYFCVRENETITALASAETDNRSRNAEMTDFATLPHQRGRGHAAALLRHMEGEMINADIRTTYTIARADSYGMNLVFKRSGYIYAGFLVNNTNIAGSIQSMTVWYKHV